jgi:molecular chaperone GrpE (heat shock protein)
VTVVKPKQSHPWNASISRDVQVTKLNAEIARLREQIKHTNAEVIRLRDELEIYRRKP